MRGFSGVFVQCIVVFFHLIINQIFQISENGFYRCFQLFSSTFFCILQFLLFQVGSILCFKCVYFVLYGRMLIKKILSDIPDYTKILYSE